MNENPELGSTWKGRILMQVQAEKTEKPILQLADLDEQEIEKAQEFMKQREFAVMIEMGSGLCLPKDKKYNLKVKIGD